MHLYARLHCAFGIAVLAFATIGAKGADQALPARPAPSMNLRFVNTIAFVRDIDVSKTFYAGLLGQKIVGDHGPFVLFENHFALHQARELTTTVWNEAPAEVDEPQGRRNTLIYFETTDLEGAFSRLKDQVKLIHPIRRQAWGQMVFRFYDPDGHVVEIGEPL